MAPGQFAYTAATDYGAGNKAVLATAVVGVPGLAIELRFGTFDTWTQANEYAERLNGDLGLTPSQSRTIVTDARLKADELISESQTLLQRAKELHQSQSVLEFLLAQLELGVTFCHMACSTRIDIGKERLLRNARRSLYNAVIALGKFEFSMDDDVGQIKAGIEHLQNALEECIGHKLDIEQKSVQ